MSIFGDLIDDVGSAGKSVLGAITGNGSDPGALGLGKGSVANTPVNQADFTNTNAGADRAAMQQQLNAVQGRAAPTMQGAQLGATATAKTAQAQPYQASQTGNLGPATDTAQTQLNQGQDQQDRGYQTGLESSLANQAAGNGPGQQLAQNAYQQANDNARKTAMSLAASGRGNQRPGLSAVLDSIAGQQQGNAAQLSNAKLQAQQDAQTQLANVSSGLRSSDLSAEGTNASLSDANAARNQDANNQFNLANFNATNANNQSNAANALQNNQFNATQRGATSQFNAGQANTMDQAQGQLNQQTDQANLEAQLKQEGMNDQDIQSYLAGINGLDQQQVANSEDYSKLASGQQTAIDTLDQKSYDDAAANRQGAIKGLTGGLTSIMSDRRVKTDIIPVSIFDGMWG